MFDSIGMQMNEIRLALKTTVLHRPGGGWTSAEIDLLVNRVMTMVSFSKDYPEYLILYGHHTKEKIKEVLASGQEHTVVQEVGINNLPFTPSFI